MFYNRARRISYRGKWEGAVHMTPKDELIKSIIRLLQYADEDKLKKIYYFILGIIK